MGLHRYHARVVWELLGLSGTSGTLLLRRRPDNLLAMRVPGVFDEVLVVHELLRQGTQHHVAADDAQIVPQIRGEVGMRVLLLDRLARELPKVRKQLALLGKV